MMVINQLSTKRYEGKGDEFDVSFLLYKVKTLKRSLKTLISPIYSIWMIVKRQLDLILHLYTSSDSSLSM